MQQVFEECGHWCWALRWALLLGGVLLCDMGGMPFPLCASGPGPVNGKKDSVNPLALLRITHTNVLEEDLAHSQCSANASHHQGKSRWMGIG